MNREKFGRDVDELKKRMKDFMEPDMYQDDLMFYRFLKARNFNVDQAETMLRNHLEWRKKYDVKNIHKTKHPEVLMKYLPYELLGYAKEGYPIRYVPVGNTDWIGITCCVKKEDLMKRIICMQEEDMLLYKKRSKKILRNVKKFVEPLPIEIIYSRQGNRFWRSNRQLRKASHE